MADKNRNGIEDSKERKRRPVFSTYTSGNNRAPVGGTPYAAREQDPGPQPRRGLFPTMFPTNRAPVSPTPFRVQSTVPTMGSDEWLAGLARSAGRRNRERGPVESDAMSFSDILAQAMEMFGGGGGGGPATVNYDPQRAAARQNASESDQKIAGIYNALVQSIEGDASGIGSSYDAAKQAQQEATQRAVTDTTAGYQSANDMLTQQAQALGIGEAVANQINSGQTNSGDMTQRLADLNASGASAEKQLNTNRQSALDYNTAVSQAARQESASRRAALASELRNILGQIDSAESQANAQAQNEWASQQGAGQSEALSLAKWMYENQTDERRYQDSMEQDAMELALRYPQQGPASGLMAPDESWALLQRLVGAQDPTGLQQYTMKSPDNLSAILDAYINLIRPRD